MINSKTEHACCLQRLRGAHRRLRAGSRGDAMTEFALVVPIFAMLLFGVMDVGKAVYAYSYVSYAAREATRYAAVHGGDSKDPASSADIQNFVANEMHGLSAKQLSVTTSWSPDNNRGSVVKVKVQYSMAIDVPLLAAKTLALASASQMVISQ
jgi:Flp pilus assembly protein TadG